MKTINLILSIYLLLSLILIENGYCQYPFYPTNTQHKIAGTIGEERGGRNRYHYGLDFSGFTAGTNVYAVETGSLRRNSTNSFAIGRIGYIHVEPNNYIKSLPIGGQVLAGTLIGTLQAISMPHVHLQEATTNIFSPTNAGPNFAWEDQTFNWINPILSRQPVDNVSPKIDLIKFYRQGDNALTDLQNVVKLYGKYDLMVETKDGRILSNGSAEWGGTAPLKIQYKVTDNYGSIITDWNGIDFSNVPPNGSASTIFGANSNYNPPKFEYIITNDPFTKPYDKSFNTRKHGLYYNTTNWPLAAKYKDGTKLRIFVRSCDESNNCANEILIPTSTGVYEVDNFQPYIENVNVKFANRKLYTLNRFAASLSTENSGFLKNKISKRAFIPSPGSEIELTVNTSEVLSELKIGYNLNSDGLPSNYYDMTQSMNNKLVWSYKFRPPLLNDKDFYFFTFKGKDISTNEIVDVYWSSLQNGNTSVPIPCRINNVGTEWTNVPSIAPGKDHVKVPFNFCGRSMQNDENCKVLENLESSLTYNSCKDATISLHAQNFDPANFLITWSDEAGNILKDYNDKNIISITTPGTYCYKIEAIDDCCSMEGCVEVIEDNMINSIAITGEVIYATCNKSVDIKTNLVASDNNKPYTYRWSTGSDKDAITVDNGGSYCVTVTGNNGCSNSMCFDVEDRKINITANPDPICQQGTGSISPTVTGGTEPYNFEWSNGETTQEIFDLPLGTYYLLVEDANGCWGNAEFEVKLNDKIVEVSHFENLQDCDIPDGKIIIKNLTDEDIIYQWYNSNGDLISTNKDITNLKAGEYTLVAKSNSGCTTELKQSICCCKPGINTGDPGACYFGYNKDLTVTGTVTHTSNGQNNGSVFLVVQGGKGQYIFTWTGPDGYSSSEKDIANLSQGEYTVTVTDGCATITKTFIINDGLICKQANIIITGKTTCIFPGAQPGIIDISVSGGSPPYTYQWSTDGSTNQDYSSFYNGSTVTVTDKNGCTAKKDFQLEKATPLNVDFEITNQDGCDEWVNNVILKVKVNSGNPPYIITINANSYVFSNSTFELQLNTGFGYWDKQVLYINLRDACNQNKIYNKPLECNSFCPNNCIKLSFTNKGPGGCIDTYTNTQVGELNHSHFKYECKCDNVDIDVMNPVDGGTPINFKGKGSHESSKPVWAPGKFPIEIKNNITGCKQTIIMDGTDECWNLFTKFIELGGGGNPGTNTNTSTICDWYTISVDSDLTDFDNPICQRVDKCDETGKTKVIKTPLKKCDVYDTQSDLWGTIAYCEYSCDFFALGDPHESKENDKCPDCIVFANSPQSTNRILPPVCKDEISDLIFNDVEGNYILFYSNMLDSSVNLNGFTFKKSKNPTDFNGYSSFKYGPAASLIRTDLNKNHYILSKTPGESPQFQKLDKLGKTQWSQTLSDVEVKSISDGNSGSYDLLAFLPSQDKYTTTNFDSDGNLIQVRDLPLKPLSYDIMHQSGTTTVASLQDEGKIVFGSNISQTFKELPSGVIVKDIKTLENGNILVAGEYNGTVTIEGKSHDSEGYKNAIFMTYDKDGNILHSKSVQNYRDETIKGIATKKSSEVAYHGRYQEVVYYDIDPSLNQIDSCIFVYIIKLTNDSCSADIPEMLINSDKCLLTWDAPADSVTVTLQKQVNGSWVDVADVSAPYLVPENGSYRLLATKAGCTPSISDVIEVTCSDDPPVPCDDEPIDITYVSGEQKFLYFYKSSSSGLQVKSNWVSPVTYQSVQEFLTWTCEDIIIKDIKVDEQYNVYVAGLDIQTQTKTRIIKYNWSTQQVIWSQWIETFIYESVLLNTQQNLIMVAGYDTVINQWRIAQYNKSSGVIVSTQPFPNKCGVTKGKFDCSYLTMHRDNIYTYFENFQLRYESPNTNWVAPLPPTVKVRKVDILHSNGVVVGGDFEGSIIIDGISYSSGTYRAIIVIVFNQFGRVETVKVFKSSKHRVLKSFTSDGYYNLAYIGYNTENINIGQSTLLDLTAMANHPDVCAETGGIKLNNLGLRNKSGENLSPDVRFYPNPFSKGINLSLDAIKEEAVTIKAYNNVGHLVFEDILHVQQGKNVAYLEAFEKLPPGVYVVKLNSLTMEHVSRIIRIE